MWWFIQPIVFLLVLGVLHNVSAIARDFDQSVRSLVGSVAPKERVGVFWVYDGVSGHVTALGDLWQDRIEGALLRAKVKVVARHDLKAVYEEIGTFGRQNDDFEALLARAGADVVLSARYYISDDRMELHLKTTRKKNNDLLGSTVWRQPLEAGWARQAAVVRRNLFQKDVETFKPMLDVPGPWLKAWLDRNPACYREGDRARVVVKTEEGMHVYLLSLAADASVMLLYPNRLLPDKVLATGVLEFPPPLMEVSGDLVLVLYPLEEGRTSRESIKVVVSRNPLDFSFLPIPIGEVFMGARGGKIKQVLQVLRDARDWSEVKLNYWVGSGCKQ